MFESLDPQDPPVFGADAVSAVRTKARHLRRRKHAVTGVAASGACAALVGTGLAVRWGGAFNRIDKVTVAAADPKADSLDRPMNILVVGWDTRTAEEQVRDSVSGKRADVIRLVRIDPASNKVTELAFPRDLATVDEEGKGRRWSNFATLDQVANAVERIGLPVDHAIGIDMAGFADIVDSLGGVRLELAATGVQRAGSGAAIIDRSSGLHEAIDESAPPPAGEAALDVVTTSCRSWSGAEVMALVRSRHTEIEDAHFDVQWLDPSDFTRIDHQTQVGEAIVDKMLAEGIDVSTIDSLLTVAGDRLERDSGLSAGLLVQLGLQFADDTQFLHLQLEGVEAIGRQGAAWIAGSQTSATNAAAWKEFGSTTGPTALNVPEATPTPSAPASTPGSPGPVLTAAAC